MLHIYIVAGFVLPVLAANAGADVNILCLGEIQIPMWSANELPIEISNRCDERALVTVHLKETSKEGVFINLHCNSNIVTREVSVELKSLTKFTFKAPVGEKLSFVGMTAVVNS